MQLLDQFACDSKVERPLWHHLRPRLDALRGNHADLAPQLVVDLVCRNLGNFVLCVNLTTNSGELNSRKETGVALQFFLSSLMR